MFACVKVINPGMATTPFTETILNVKDALTGTPFAMTGMFTMGGYLPSNTLTYYGTFDDSSFHWDMGFYSPASQGANGGGTCFDFAVKVCSGADAYGFAFLDTFPDIFFGGAVGGYGYVNNVLPGQFDITWPSRTRGGDSRMVLCVGDTDLSLEVNPSAVTGTYGFTQKPQGFMTYPTVFGTGGSGPVPTGAGGTGWNVGWCSRDNDMGITYDTSINQGNNTRQQWTDRWEPGGSFISNWANLTYTIANGTGARFPQAVFCGTNIRTKGGKFRAPATDGIFKFDCGVNPRFVAFQTVGLAPGALDSVNSSGCIGFADGVNQASFWTGESTIGNTTLKGARFLSTSTVVRNGIANNALTTQVNIGNVISTDEFGHVVMSFVNTDGSQPEIVWFAVGRDATPQLFTGVHFINPNKPAKHDSYIHGSEVKIPDPTIRSALIGS